MRVNEFVPQKVRVNEFVLMMSIQFRWWMEKEEEVKGKEEGYCQEGEGERREL